MGECSSWIGDGMLNVSPLVHRELMEECHKKSSEWAKFDLKLVLDYFCRDKRVFC